MDLIRGQATVDVQLVVTVPAEAADGFVPAAGPGRRRSTDAATDGCPADVRFRRGAGRMTRLPARRAARRATALGLSLDRDDAAAVSTRRLAVAERGRPRPW